jgi:two-component system response regulator
MLEPNALTVLHVESDDDHAALFAEAAAAAGGIESVIRCRSSEEARAFLEESNGCEPDIVLLDLRLPGSSGFSLLRWLKSRDRFCEIPVIVLTAWNDQRRIRRAYRLGASSYIVKPTNPETLIIKLAEINMYWSMTAATPSGTDRAYGLEDAGY